MIMAVVTVSAISRGQSRNLEI